MHLKKISVISVIKGIKPSLYNSFDTLYKQGKDHFDHTVIFKDISPDDIKILNKRYPQSQFIIEKDNNYKNKFFAINQAINEVKTEYICFLHDDDHYINDNYLKDSNKIINKENVDIISSNIKFHLNGKTQRSWKLNKKYNYFSFHNIPAHTSIIYKKDLHNELGYYSLDFPIAADFDFMINLISKSNLRVKHINYYSLSMSLGGDSTSIKNIYKVFMEDLKIFKKNNLSFPITRTFLKKILKINQYYYE